MQSLQEQDVHVAIWGEMTSPELAQFRERIRGQHQRCGGRPLVYVGVVPENAPMPSADERKGIVQAMREISEMCDYMCIIFKGSGFKHSAKRTAFAGLMMMTMKGKWHVAARLDDLIDKAEGDLRRVSQLQCAKRLAAGAGEQA
jgi:hypothetical protein